MFSNKRSLIKYLFVVIMLGISSGFIFNYYYGTNRKTGLASPVVYGKDISKLAETPLSPFAALFKTKSRQAEKVEVPPASGTLSYFGNLPKEAKSGAVLGEGAVNTSLSNEAPSPANSPASEAPNSNLQNSINTSNNSPGSSNNYNSDSVQTNSNSSTSTSTSQDALTSAQQAVEDVTNVVIGYLKSRNYNALYNLMSADFKNTFSLEDFISSFVSATGISNGALTESPKIYGENSQWAEQPIRLSLSDGSSQNYLNVYHLENSAWTLFTTQDQ